MQTKDRTGPLSGHNNTKIEVGILIGLIDDDNGYGAKSG
jgi:hypothetical protein